MAITNSLTDSDYGINSTTGTSSTTGSSSQDLQNSFLTLLVAQLKNQDPTNPMQNNELTTQLAQINTVSGIEKLNTTLGSISGQIDNSQSLQQPDWSRCDGSGNQRVGWQQRWRCDDNTVWC